MRFFAFAQNDGVKRGSRKKKDKNMIKFGFCIPIFANPGMLFFRTPAYKKLDWDSIKKTVIKAEKLGFDSLFVADHLFLGKDGDIWECISTMSALLAITENISVIPIHLCDSFRHPGVVAKTFATMSHISKGRVELFYDYGWRKSEFDQYGIDFGNDDERIEKMAEGIKIIKGMLTEDRFSFKGKHYNIENAICNPKPVKKIPIWMGEVNNPKMVEAIVKEADVFNSMPCSAEAFKNKQEVIKTECKKQNRDFSSLKFSLETQILIRETEKEVEETLKEYSMFIGENNSFDQDILKQLEATSIDGTDFSSIETVKKEFMIGTPKSIKEQIDEFISLGVDHFMIWFMDYPSDKGMKLFADTVMREYK